MTRGDTRRALLTALLGLVAYLLLGLLGRATTLPGEVLALVWPAAGAAIVLVALMPPRWWAAGAAALAAATFALNAGTGIDPLLSAAFVVPNLLQGLVGAAALRRTAPHLVLGGGRWGLGAFRDYVLLMAAAVVSSLVAVLVGTGVVGWAAGTWSVADALLWLGRNTVGALVVLTLAEILLGETHEVDARVRPGREHKLRWGAELLAAYAVTAVLYALGFTAWQDVSQGFALLVPTVWVGLRFGLRSVVVHAMVCSVVVVVATMRGQGTFAEAASQDQAALLTQVYLGLLFSLGVLLALAAKERRRLASTLREAHASAANQAALLSTVVDSMREGVAILDDQGRMQLQNPASRDLLRSTSADLEDAGEAAFEVRDVGGEPLAVEQWPFARAIRGEEVVGHELRLVFRDGTPDRDVSVSARRLPFVTDDGHAQAVVIYHDVTVERAQRVALETFARTVAHDLKGPLGIVEGWAELLVGEAEQREAVPSQEVVATGNRIRNAALTMRDLIRDLLESSMSRDQQLRVSEIDLRRLAEEVADQHRTVVDGAVPSIVVDPDLPRVSADEPQVRQLLHNLVGNAVKYVAPGEVADVVVSGRHLGAQVEVVVADRGIGIPRGRHDQVFAVFSRAHGAEGEYEGHGIGLSVCKTIVDRHGGTIHARPRRSGRGTAFVFTLPAVRTADQRRG